LLHFAGRPLAWGKDALATNIAYNIARKASICGPRFKGNDRARLKLGQWAGIVGSFSCRNVRRQDSPTRCYSRRTGPSYLVRVSNPGPPRRAFPRPNPSRRFRDYSIRVEVAAAHIVDETGGSLDSPTDPAGGARRVEKEQKGPRSDRGRLYQRAAAGLGKRSDNRRCRRWPELPTHHV